MAKEKKFAMMGDLSVGVSHIDWQKGKDVTEKVMDGLLDIMADYLIKHKCCMGGGYHFVKEKLK